MPVEYTLNFWEIMLTALSTLLAVGASLWWFFKDWKREAEASDKRIVELISQLIGSSTQEHQKLMDYIEKRTKVLEAQIVKLEDEIQEFRREHVAHDVRVNEKMKK